MYLVNSRFYDFMIVIGIVLAIAMIGLFIVVFITVAKTADSANKATKNLVDQMKDQKTYTLDQLNVAKRQAWYQGYNAAVQQTDGIKHTMDNATVNNAPATNEAKTPANETAAVEETEVIETATDIQPETPVEDTNDSGNVKDAENTENTTSDKKDDKQNA